MFRTELNIDPSPWKINISSKVLSLGSCFAIHIGELLQQNKFDALTNPFGVLFNPASIFGLLQKSLQEQSPEAWTFIDNQGINRNLLFHSAISSVNKEDLVDRIQNAMKLCKRYITNADVLVLTLGSAVVYEWKENGMIVSNCHKLPASYFNKRLLDVNEIIDHFSTVYNAILSQNKDMKVIITVSPVRHIKDTLTLNNVSKSTLRLATHEIVNKYENVAYFPSYELLMDDLRDYRFYDEDMVHPNNQAINYVWQKFSEMYFDRPTIEFIEEWKSIQKALNHKPFHPDSEVHQNFVKKTIQKLVRLQKIVNVDKELTALKQQIP